MGKKSRKPFQRELTRHSELPGGLGFETDIFASTLKFLKPGNADPLSVFFIFKDTGYHARKLTVSSYRPTLMSG